ncbi:MAG TPA: integrase family protein [Pseudolabrys sp.]|nr:integrase family protein [Pseudolabrys sp.]
MPRARQDGQPARSPNKRKLSEIFLRKLKPKAQAFAVWDIHQRGLCVLMQPTGHKSWKCVYPFQGRPRWYHIGAVDAVNLADARKLASRVMFQVAEGKDPAAEKRAERGKGTFEELAMRYVNEYAKRENKSWQQADKLVRSNLIPRWRKLQAAAITRGDVKVMMGSIASPTVANQTLAAASAIFAWAIREEIVKTNPCQLVERNKTKSRERVLSDNEISKFWSAFDSAGLVASTALKMILLTGQRPGEVAHMRREHIEDGWWTMPGDPVPELDWPGTKNGATHRIWLPAAAQRLIAELDGDGFVFANSRGSAVDKLDNAMRTICPVLKVERATPHDLRRTHGTKITGLGFGRDAMNRIQNHKEGGIASVYDRHEYAAENKRIMEAVATHIMMLVEGGPSNIIQARFARGD